MVKTKQNIIQYALDKDYHIYGSLLILIALIAMAIASTTFHNISLNKPATNTDINELKHLSGNSVVSKMIVRTAIVNKERLTKREIVQIKAKLQQLKSDRNHAQIGQ